MRFSPEGYSVPRAAMPWEFQTYAPRSDGHGGRHANGWSTFCQSRSRAPIASKASFYPVRLGLSAQLRRAESFRMLVDIFQCGVKGRSETPSSLVGLARAPASSLTQHSCFHMYLGLLIE
jgi:hypothetical protein